MPAAARLVLRKNQDRRVRAGHPWIFSNEVAGVDGAPADGGLVEVTDARGAFLGRAYYNRHSLIAARILSRGRDEIDLDFFVRRIERAVAYRRHVLPDVEALRLVHGEADQLPGLVVDRYGDSLAVQLLTLGMEVQSELLREALTRVLSPRGVVRVADAPVRKLEGLELERGVWWGEVPERTHVSQEGFRVEVDLLSGQKTGLFLDQRSNRRLAESRAAGRRALDLFCYQGEWALHLLRGGAPSVLAVDASASALAAAGRNLQANGQEEGVELRTSDAFDALRALEAARERFGLIVADPPALVRSRNHLPAGARAYREINRAAMTLLAEGGVLVTCSCSHHMRDDLFEQVLREAARAARRSFRIASWTAAAPDHPRLLAVPETHYLKCAVLEAV